MVSGYLSNKIKILSFICTIMVVYRHSYNDVAFYGYRNALTGLNKVIQDGVMSMTEIAVPCFFLISGFFFFDKSYYTIANYSQMLKKKMTGLLVPFLIWNTVGGIILYFYDMRLLGHGIKEILVKFITSQWYGPLWYVRELLLYMLLYPLYGWIFRRTNRAFLYVMLLLLLVLWEPVCCNVFAFEGMFFFLLGGYICNENLLVQRVAIRMEYIVFFILLWCIFNLSYNFWSNIYLHKLNILIGMVLSWLLVHKITGKIEHLFLWCSSYSFIIYVTHFYFIKVPKLLIGKGFSENSIISCLSFIFLPLLISYLIIIVSSIIKEHYNKVYSIITGNR